MAQTRLECIGRSQSNDRYRNSVITVPAHTQSVTPAGVHIVAKLTSGSRRVPKRNSRRPSTFLITRQHLSGGCWLSQLQYDSARQSLLCRPREDSQRSFFHAFHPSPLRSMVPASRVGRWQWRVVVSLFADESGASRLPGRSKRHARASVGHLVSSAGQTAKLHSRIPIPRAAPKRERQQPFSFPDRRQRNRRCFLPGIFTRRWAHCFLGLALQFDIPHDAQFKGLDRLLSDATFRCDFLRRDYARR